MVMDSSILGLQKPIACHEEALRACLKAQLRRLRSRMLIWEGPVAAYARVPCVCCGQVHGWCADSTARSWPPASCTPRQNANSALTSSP